MKKIFRLYKWPDGSLSTEPLHVSGNSKCYREIVFGVLAINCSAITLGLLTEVPPIFIARLTALATVAALFGAKQCFGEQLNLNRINRITKRQLLLNEHQNRAQNARPILAAKPVESAVLVRQ